MLLHFCAKSMKIKYTKNIQNKFFLISDLVNNTGQPEEKFGKLFFDSNHGFGMIDLWIINTFLQTSVWI